MELKKKIVFILNPISGTANKTGIPYLIDTIIDKERFDCTTVFTERAGHASELEIGRASCRERVSEAV